MLSAKLQSLQTDNVTLKRTLADNKIQVERLEAQLLESSEQLEMMMLDKEVAEERAETAESDLEAEREKRLDAEIKLEVYESGGMNFVSILQNSALTHN